MDGENITMLHSQISLFSVRLYDSMAHPVKAIPYLFSYLQRICGANGANANEWPRNHPMASQNDFKTRVDFKFRFAEKGQHSLGNSVEFCFF